MSTTLPFNLSIPLTSGSIKDVWLDVGQTIFVLGANGTGKSSLLHLIAARAGGHSKRISANRQTWFNSNGLEFAPSQKAQFEVQAQNWNNTTQSRYMEQNAQIRYGLTLYDLLDAENTDARSIAVALRENNVMLAQKLAQKTAPVAQINNLLACSGIPIVISIESGDRLIASKAGGAPYGAAELSDGERNALLIAADVLTAKPGTLLIIDEPERHLHRSIISPLLSALFQNRADCAFVVATHDLMLPLDNPEAFALLVRSCIYNGQRPSQWDIDLIESNTGINESLKRDIVGARRHILFTEGDESSLDKPLYAILFPRISVRSKGTSREVEQSTIGLRAEEPAHWVRAWGIIDHDGRDAADVEALKQRGIFALPLHSVEALYYHPDTIQGVALRQAKAIGGDGHTNAKSAIAGALRALDGQFERLAARAVEKRIRRQFFGHLPTLKDIQNGAPISVQIDVAAVLKAESESLREAAERGDWLEILSRCPIRETGARGAVAKAVGLQDYRQYESAVLQLLRQDAAAANKMRDLFGDLSKELIV